MNSATMRQMFCWKFFGKHSRLKLEKDIRKVYKYIQAKLLPQS